VNTATATEPVKFSCGGWCPGVHAQLRLLPPHNETTDLHVPDQALLGRLELPLLFLLVVILLLPSSASAYTAAAVLPINASTSYELRG
jgi:hypothetical protein